MEPAFPASTFTNDGLGGVEWRHPGMTLRDYFAASALSVVPKPADENNYAAYAARAYRMADAMLAARGAK
jgi:hypothetical protein